MQEPQDLLRAMFDRTVQVADPMRSLGADDFVLALISGGGPALPCAPATGITLGEKQKLNRALLDSGAPIDLMNVVRKHLSQVKGGQLAAAACPARMLCLLISDVLGDDPAFIGSGPTVGGPSTPADALAVIGRWGIAVPPSVAAALAADSDVVPPGDPRLVRVENRTHAAQVVVGPTLNNVNDFRATFAQPSH